MEGGDSQNVGAALHRERIPRSLEGIGAQVLRREAFLAAGHTQTFRQSFSCKILSICNLPYVHEAMVCQIVEDRLVYATELYIT